MVVTIAPFKRRQTACCFSQQSVSSQVDHHSIPKTAAANIIFLAARSLGKSRTINEWFYNWVI